MGGLFIRKLSGVAGLAFHTTKMWPIVFQSPPVYDKTSVNGRWVGASWSAGHFDPLLTLGMIGDICISIFYLTRLDELKNAGAQGIGLAFVMASLVESFIFGVYLFTRRMNDKTTKPLREKVDVTTGEYDLLEDPDSLPSRIVARTVFIVSSLISLVSLRDLFFPGIIMPFIPRDDIYLEWTGVFLHSPPPDTVEADENGLGAPLFAGDKFVSQLLGLYLSLGCMFKIFSSWGWSKGNRGMGKMESVDRSGVRWHLMLVSYEAFILCESVACCTVVAQNMTTTSPSNNIHRTIMVQSSMDSGKLTCCYFQQHSILVIYKEPSSKQEPSSSMNSNIL